MSFRTTHQAAKQEVGSKLNKQGEIIQTRHNISKDEMKKCVVS